MGRKYSTAVFAISAALISLALPRSVLAAPKTHDGFYFKGALGLGYLSSGIREEPHNTPFGGTTASGIGASGLLFFGGTPMEHLVLGGGTTGGHFATPKLKDGGYEADAEHDFLFTLTGPGAAYYFDQHGGVHVIGLWGFAMLDPGTGGDTYAKGSGAAVGAGYDWWVGDEWSLGILGRVVMMRTSTELDGHDYSHSTLSPAVLFSATYH